MNIPMVNIAPQLAATEAEWKANLERLFERMHFICSEQLERFEEEFASAMNAKRAVGVGTGTAAIELCLRAAGLAGSQREVIVPALTSLFTAQAILAAGCVPRFADVDPETLLLDPREVERLLNRKTGAILPVHLYGRPCELDQLARLARSAGVALIQDACQAHGARFAGRPLTWFSPYVAYSFYPTKNLGALGDGGAVATSSQAIAGKLRLLRDGGRRNDQVSRIPAINSRLDEMQCCFLRAFLTRLDEWGRMRAGLARSYDELLQAGVKVRPVARGEWSVNHLYVVRTRHRERLRAHLAKYGIGTAVHYPAPLHLQPAFRTKAAGKGDLPHAEKACREILSLPLWPYLKEEQVRQVASRILEF
jgi:dTDP-3-amino-3,4,6-trideoxy-alpha-D-glucose transaminase